jgi:hypothetical protein
MCERDQGDLVLGELREGLRALRVPETSPEFDTRILAAYRECRERQSRTRITIFSAIVGAASSCALILLVAQILLQSPIQLGPSVASKSRIPAGTVDALDQMLDDPSIRVPAMNQLSICGGWTRLLQDKTTNTTDDGERKSGPRSDRGTSKYALA